MIILFNKKFLSYSLLIGLLLTILSINVFISKADTSPIEWSKTFGGVGDEIANCMIKTNDGNYVIAGSTTSYGAGGTDFWLLKIDEDGNLLWNTTYGTTDNETGNSVIQTNDGGYVIAGSTISYSASTIDYWLIKIDENGNLLWNKTFAGVWTNYGTGSSVIQTNDGGYALAGSNGWLLKLDSSGNLQWNQTLKSSYVSLTSVDSIFQTNDGGYAVMGTGARLDYRQYLIKTDSSGNQLWENILSGRSSYVSSMIHTNDDGFGLIGSYNNRIAGYDTLFFRILDSNGTVIGEYSGRLIFPGSSSNSAYSDGLAVVQTNDGGYTLVGNAYGYADPPYNFRYSYLWLIKVNSTGHEIWNTTLTAPISSIFIQTSDDGYAFVGSTTVRPYLGGDFWLVKTDSYGNLLLNKTFGGVGTDIAKSVIETSDGFLLAGYTDSFGAGGYDFYVVKTTSPLTPTSTLTVLNSENGIMYPSPGTYLPSDLGDDAAWLIAHPDPGYKFSHFLIDGIQTSAQYFEDDGDYTYYLKTDTSHTVQAVFTVGTPVFPTLTVYDSLGGTMYPFPGTYSSSITGEATWLIARPNVGYKFSHFLIDGIATPAQYLEEDGDYTYYLNMDTSHTVQAVFSVGSSVPSILTVLNSVGGTMYPSPGNYTPSYLGDGAAWLIAHPNAGYKFNYFLIDGVITLNQYLEEDGDYTYYLSTNISHTVQAIFVSS